MNSCKAILATTLLLAVPSLVIASSGDRGWTVPHTTPIRVDGTQFSDDPIMPCRIVSIRNKYQAFDTWGDITLFPVVRSPEGKLYYGFVRHFKARKLGLRSIDYSFPFSFRADKSEKMSEADADSGDRMSDFHIPAGHFTVKWVVNGKLIDNGDGFDFPGTKGLL